MAKKITDRKTALNTLERVSDENGVREFIHVANPSYVYQPSDIYMLAPRMEQPVPEVRAIVKDMDGTTTTTEPLCLHSLEYMVRRISSRRSEGDWKGLDQEKDYPHVIGNSTTKHVEYLIDTYHDAIRRTPFLVAYIHSVLWTIGAGKDSKRKLEVRKNADALGIGGVLEERDVQELFSSENAYDDQHALEIAKNLADRYEQKFILEDLHDEVRAAVDIYYQRYHYILSRIDKGEGAELAKTVGLEEGQHLVEPMPGVAVFLAAIKGWLGEDLEKFHDEFAEYLAAHPLTPYKKGDFHAAKGSLRELGRYLEQHPIRVAIVTSSILYEANIVLNEVFSIVRDQIREWDIADKKKELILGRFASYNDYYDAVITASDSSEIRLKPHRDLYSLALYQLGITPDEFTYCIGFEDSESGVIAIRAAGIGLCVGVPFADSAGHNLEAATFILHGGLPETMLKHNLFIERTTTQSKST